MFSKKISLTHSWIVWSVAALFFCYQFFLRVSPSVMADDLMHDFSVDACSLGTLTSFYFYAYAGWQLPVGAALDRIGPRYLLTFAAGLCFVGALLFSQAETVFQASLARFLIGSGSACGFLSCMKLGTTWFPPEKLSMVIGFTLLFGTLGAMSGSAPMSYMVDSLGWREAMWSASSIGIVLALLIWLVVRDQSPLLFKASETHARDSILHSIKTVAGKSQTWLLAFYGFAMFAPLAGFADIWGTSFFTTAHAMDKSTAATGISLLYLGVGIGTPAFAFLNGRINVSKPILWSSAIGTLVGLCILFYTSNLPPFFILPLLFVTGFFLGGQFLIYTTVCRINPLSMSGTATSIQNMAGLTSGVVMQPLIGWILRILWTGYTENDIPVYSVFEYQMALSSIVVCIILALCALVFIQEANKS